MKEQGLGGFLANPGNFLQTSSQKILNLKKKKNFLENRLMDNRFSTDFRNNKIDSIAHRKSTMDR